MASEDKAQRQFNDKVRFILWVIGLGTLFATCSMEVQYGRKPEESDIERVYGVVTSVKQENVSRSFKRSEMRIVYRLQYRPQRFAIPFPDMKTRPGTSASEGDTVTLLVEHEDFARSNGDNVVDIWGILNGEDTALAPDQIVSEVEERRPMRNVWLGVSALCFILLFFARKRGWEKQAEREEKAERSMEYYPPRQ